MAKIQQHITEFDYDATRGKFRTWLWSIVANLAKSQARKRKARPEDTTFWKSLQDGSPAPEEVFEQVWRQDLAQTAFRMLRQRTTERDCQAFEHYAVKEVAAEEVCKQFSITRDQLYLNVA